MAIPNSLGKISIFALHMFLNVVTGGITKSCRTLLQLRQENIQKEEKKPKNDNSIAELICRPDLSIPIGDWNIVVHATLKFSGCRVCHLI